MAKRLFKYFIIVVSILIFALLGAVTTAYLMRNQLIQLFVNEANKSIVTEIHVDKISLEFIQTFPEFAIEFEGVEIIEAVPKSKKSLAVAEKLYFSFSIWDLLKQKYKIKNLYLKNATLNFKIFEDGSNNFSIIRKNTDTTQKTKIIFNLKKVKLENVDFTFTDLGLKNNYSAIFSQANANFKLIDEDWAISIDGDLFSRDVTLNNWSFFKDKEASVESKIIYLSKAKLYKILPSQLKVMNALFNIEGTYQDGKSSYIDLKFSEENSDFQTIISFLPTKISEYLLAYKSKGEIYFNGIVQGEVSRTEKTHIKIDFGCENASFFHPEYNTGIEKVSFKGLFDNQAKEEKKGVFKLDNISAYMNGKPFVGNFYLRSFYKPYIELKAKSSIDAAYFLKAFPISGVEFAKGEIDFDVDFKGELADLKSKNYENLHTTGHFDLKDLNFKLQSYHLAINALNAGLTFTKTDLHADNFSMQLGESDVRASGSLGNIFPYFFAKDQPLHITAKMESEHLNLDELLSTSTTSDSSTYKFKISPKLSFDIESDIKYLRFQKFKPHNVKGKLTLKNRQMVAKDVAMEIAQGKLTLDGQLTQNPDTSFTTEINFKLDKMQIDSIYYMTDNFGQAFMTYKNLKGEISSEVKTIFDFDQFLNISTKSIVAEANTTIKNGQLVNFLPMKNLAKFVNEEALENIKFSTLKNTIQISKEVVYIPEMEITSNINKMSVMGTHGFNNEFEYKFKIPLKNYKKKDNLEEQQALEGNIFSGFYLYLIIKGNPNNFKIIYDKAAVKQKIKERWQEEKKEVKEIFKKDFQKKQLEKQKPVEINEDEYLDL